MGHFRTAVVAVALNFAAILFGDVLPYTPRANLNLLEPWRWRELEPLNDYTLICGIENTDETLVFGKNDGILVYNGYTSQEYPFPAEFEIKEIYQLYLSQNGRIYVYTSSGILSFEKGRFSMEMAFQTSLEDIQNLIVKSPYGLEVTYTPKGVYQIVGYDFVHIPQIIDGAENLVFDSRNILWMAAQNTNDIVSYQFGNHQISDPVIRKNYNLESNVLLSSKVVGSPTIDEL